MPGSEVRSPEASATLLGMLVRDFGSLARECHRDGMTWKEISTTSGLPEYVCKVIAGETVGSRPSVDRQSGR